MRWKKLKIVRVVKENPRNSFARWSIYDKKFQHISFPFFLKHHQIRSGWGESPACCVTRLEISEFTTTTFGSKFMQNVSNVVEEISFESVMLFHQNGIFPSTMRKVADILTEIYLHIASDVMFSYFNLQWKEYRREKRALFPRVFFDASRRIWLCERSLT